MIARQNQWRWVRRPLRISLRGWALGFRSLISPRGTVFETRATRYGLVARKRRDFQLDQT